MHFFSVIALSAALAAVANAFPTGAGTCLSNATVIAAGGGGAMGKPTELGFGINVGLKGTYSPGDSTPINVMITGDKQFVGILIYALDKQKNHVGSWFPSTGIQFKTCQGDPKGTLTHTNPSKKGPTFGLLWVPPTTSAGDIFFTASLVTGKATGFQVVKSDVFTASGDGASGNGTSPASATPTSEPKPAKGKKPKGKGTKTKGTKGTKTTSADASPASPTSSESPVASPDTGSAQGDGQVSYETVTVDASLASAIATATAGALIPNLADSAPAASPTISLTSGASSVRPVSFAIAAVAALAFLL